MHQCIYHLTAILCNNNALFVSAKIHLNCLICICACTPFIPLPFCWTSQSMPSCPLILAALMNTVEIVDSSIYIGGVRPMPPHFFLTIYLFSPMPHMSPMPQVSVLFSILPPTYISNIQANKTNTCTCLYSRLCPLHQLRRIKYDPRVQGRLVSVQRE